MERPRRSSKNIARGPAAQLTPLGALHIASNSRPRSSQGLPRPGSAQSARPAKVGAAVGTPGRLAPGLIRQRSGSADGSFWQPDVQDSRPSNIPARNVQELAHRPPPTHARSADEAVQCSPGQGQTAQVRALGKVSGEMGHQIPGSPFTGGVASTATNAGVPVAEKAKAVGVRQPSGRPPLARKPLLHQRSVSLDGAAAMLRFGAAGHNLSPSSQMQSQQLPAPAGHKRSAERADAAAHLYRQRSHSMGSLHAAAVASFGGRPVFAAASPQRLPVPQEPKQARALPVRGKSLEQLARIPQAAGNKSLMRQRSVSADGAMAAAQKYDREEGAPPSSAPPSSRRTAAHRGTTPAFTDMQRCAAYKKNKCNQNFCATSQANIFCHQHFVNFQATVQRSDICIPPSVMLEMPAPKVLCKVGQKFHRCMLG